MLNFTLNPMVASGVSETGSIGSQFEARLVAKLGAIFWGDILVDIPGRRPNIDQISTSQQEAKKGFKMNVFLRTYVQLQQQRRRRRQRRRR
jgi:hypothetical protein